MKHNYTAWRHLDPAPTDTKGAIIELIEKNHKDTTQQIASVKTAAEEEIGKAKKEIKSDFETRITEAKSTSQKALDVAEETQKQLATVKSFGSQPQATKSFDQVIRAALEENEANLVKMINKEPGRQENWSIDLDLKGVSTKAVGDVSIANYTGGTRGLTALRPGIITNNNRKVHVRDIMATGNIGPGTDYVFMKENGVGEGAIAPTAEGATKPQFDVDLIESSVKIETIAGWMRVTRKAMNNIQGFQSFLQMRLPQLMLGVEDAQILNGDGVSPNLKGIQTAGNFTAATSLAATIDIEQLILGIGQLDNMNGNATAIVLSTADYYPLILNKAAGSGEYDLPDVITVDPATGILRILGVPVIHTTAQTTGTYLIGDFDQGAQLLFQENMRIEFFEQDGTNVRENKVTVRIEETVALPVYGATYFIKGTF
jgi:HK97 family phage major capsid protein